MKPVSIVWVLAVGLLAVGLSFLGFFAHMREGGTPMIVTPGPAVIFAIATACLIWSGLAVRRLRAGKETWIDAIGAMRVAVFARASAIVGSGLSGLVGIVWCVIAIVVERWCVIDPDDEGSTSSKRSAAA